MYWGWFLYWIGIVARRFWKRLEKGIALACKVLRSFVLLFLGTGMVSRIKCDGRLFSA